MKRLMEKIKLIVGGLLSLATSVFYALFQRQKSITEEIKREQVERAAELEREANQAMVDGLGYEAGIKQNIESQPVNRTDID